MFFLLSKLLWILTAPVTILFGLLTLGIVLTFFRSERASRAGRRLALCALVAIFIGGGLPIGLLLLRPLENRFPQIPADFPAPTGIIVLGGSTDEVISEARGRPTVVNAAERITESVALSRRYPQARMVFSGGSASLSGVRRSEADDTRALWISMGIAPERITVESKSRNTDENARFTKALLKPQPGETWLLVTSAFHMPRSVGLFRANGFPVVPYPVDFRTSGTIDDVWAFVGLSEGLHRLDFAVHEWVGLAAYRLSGKIGSIFPGPEPAGTHSGA